MGELYFRVDMKILKQTLLIVAFAVVGNIASYGLSLLHFPFPGSLIGLILLFLFLLTGWVKVGDIHEVGQYFIDNMGIFFVPGAILILNNLRLLSEIWWKLVIIILAAFVVSFTATYWAVRLTLYLQNRFRKKEPIEEEAHD